MNNQDTIFITRDIFYLPMNKNIKIITQNVNGPCMLIAIANVLALKGEITFTDEIYSLESLVETIREINPKLPDLSNLIHGCNINPIFTNCANFKDYPDFLEMLNIKMFHSIVCDSKAPYFDQISQYDYDSFEMKLLESLETPNDDQTSILNEWNESILKQATPYGVEQIKNSMCDEEVAIYFRGNHFSAILKNDGQIYNLITAADFSNSQYVWQSVQVNLGDSEFYDPFFMTFDNYEAQAQTDITPNHAPISVESQEEYPTYSCSSNQNEDPTEYSTKPYYNIQNQTEFPAYEYENAPQYFNRENEVLSGYINNYDSSKCNNNAIYEKELSNNGRIVSKNDHEFSIILSNPNDAWAKHDVSSWNDSYKTHNQAYNGIWGFEDYNKSHNRNLYISQQPDHSFYY